MDTTDKKQNVENDLEAKILKQEKEIFDLKQLLEISKSLNSFIEFNHLIESILYAVMAQLKTLGVAIFIRNNFDDDFFILNRNYYGFDINREAISAIPGSSKIVKFLETQKRAISPGELNTAINSDSIVDDLISIGPSLFVPLIAKTRLIGFLLLGERMNSNYNYSSYEKNLLENICTIAAVAIRNAELLEMTTTDIMTHLKLKHYFYTVLSDRLQNICSKCKMQNFVGADPLSVLMLDIDFFKKVNDSYGHEAGDLVLTEVAKIIKQCIRESDMAARYGGEEFVVMLDGVNAEKAQIVAERIRASVENTKMIYQEKEITVTISIGIATYKLNKENSKELVDRADKALYASKQTGRNKTTIYNNSLTEN